MIWDEASMRKCVLKAVCLENRTFRLSYEEDQRNEMVGEKGELFLTFKWKIINKYFC